MPLVREGVSMARVCIYLPDDLAERVKKAEEMNVSNVCRTALDREVRSRRGGEKMRTSYSVPIHMVEGLRGYVEHGWKPGSFLRAVLENDLVESFACADSVNIRAMETWASWLYNDAPRLCWGSHEKVDSWIAHRGLEGLLEQDQKEGGVQ
jgi:hypothetical protein